ncbi:MAG: urease accessory protein UreD [Rikenellaceae bacterium]
MDARITLTIAQREGRSYPRSLYVTPPFRVVSVGQLRHDGGAYLMQMSTSPGVLSGDDYQVDITMEPNTKLQMLSQSYMRIFDMDAHATQRINITIGDGAHFSQVSHPIVPHRNSSFSSSTYVELGRQSSFLQSEIITCGRKYHGEEFLFREFSNSVEVRSCGVLRFKDRVWLNPKVTPLRTCGLLEGYTHQGTLVYQTSCESVDISSIIEHIYIQLSKVKDLDFGISKSHHDGFIIRVLGESGEALFNSFLEVQEHLWAITNK